LQDIVNTGKIADPKKQNQPLYGGRKIMASTTGAHRSFLFLFLDTSWLTISFFRITRYCEHGKNCRSKATKSTFILRLQNYGLENRCSPLILLLFP
jgi:hypothetical protein